MHFAPTRQLHRDDSPRATTMKPRMAHESVTHCASPRSPRHIPVDLLPRRTTKRVRARGSSITEAWTILRLAIVRVLRYDVVNFCWMGEKAGAPREPAYAKAPRATPSVMDREPCLNCERSGPDPCTTSATYTIKDTQKNTRMTCAVPFILTGPFPYGALRFR